jgi:hypothetical protein
MSYEDIGVANAGHGLDFVNLYGTWREEALSQQELLDVKALMAKSFVDSHAGYRLNRILKEAIGAPRLALARSTGIWQVIANFQESDSALLRVVPRQTALEVPYSTAAAIYHFREPIVGFRQGDQRLLLAALKGATDPELALQLGVSLPALKKRWLAIFMRFEKAKPNMLGPGTSTTEADVKRGAQKRHHVLSYVRTHPEELRPYFKARRRGSMV